MQKQHRSNARNLKKRYFKTLFYFYFCIFVDVPNDDNGCTLFVTELPPTRPKLIAKTLSSFLCFQSSFFLSSFLCFQNSFALPSYAFRVLSLFLLTLISSVLFYILIALTLFHLLFSELFFSSILCFHNSFYFFYIPSIALSLVLLMFLKLLFFILMLSSIFRLLFIY